MPISRKRKNIKSKSILSLIHFDDTIHSTEKYSTRSKGRYGIRLDRNVNTRKKIKTATAV